MAIRAPALGEKDPSVTAGERSFRVGWYVTLKRTDGARPEVTPDYVARQGRALRVVDVRDEAALLGALGHVPGSDWVPLSEAGTLHTKVNRFEPLVLVCEDGTRSLTLASWLEEAGLELVAAMRGGMRAWRESGLSVARDPELPKRKGVLSPLPSWAPTDSKQAFSLEEIVEHVGHPRSVRWTKLAAFLLHGRMSCVDGRDHVAVVGSPGGDAGELVLAFGAMEKLLGAPLSPKVIAELLRRRIEAFGRFAFHTDTNAGDRMIAAIRADPRTAPAVAGLSDPLAFRQFFASPPEQYREGLTDIMGRAEHVGCGHLRLSLQHPARWGIREGLTRDVLAAALNLRWQGAQELEITPLPGGHSEGAVVNIHVSEELDAFSLVPLVAPSISGRQMFVNHPHVASFLRKQMARWLSQQRDLCGQPPAATALFEAMQTLHQQQLLATLGELAAGLPVFDVTVNPDGRADVKQTGSIPLKA
ncbi:MAG: rhodanese-like domain-containing protein [Archangium sp.]|nr:rhodanese-like domain-containing protein [Archangium sp.]MDP3153261.1 rhodanese-like domain-containing protein [Archangium sp.]MDP3570295.1 rhodanese-like domain-containing protein [Archangium sp.]